MESVMSTMDIAAKIKQLRHQIGITQEEFAHRTQIPLNMIKRYESGIIRPNRDNMMRIAYVLSNNASLINTAMVDTQLNHSPSQEDEMFVKRTANMCIADKICQNEAQYAKDLAQLATLLAGFTPEDRAKIINMIAPFSATPAAPIGQPQPRKRRSELHHKFIGQFEVTGTYQKPLNATTLQEATDPDNFSWDESQFAPLTDIEVKMTAVTDPDGITYII